MKTIFKTPIKLKKIASFCMKYFKYVVSVIFIVFFLIYQWVAIILKNSQSNDFEVVQAVFDFFLSYILVTSLKDCLEKWIRGKFYRFKSFNKIIIIIITIMVILMLIVLIIFVPLFFIIGMIILIPLLLSVFIFFFSNDTEEILESFVFTSSFISIGFLITIIFIIIPLIPNFDPIKFIYKYLFIIFIEMFELIDKNFDIDKKQKKYMKVGKKD
jgi:hypothetical protein